MTLKTDLFYSQIPALFTYHQRTSFILPAANRNKYRDLEIVCPRRNVSENPRKTISFIILRYLDFLILIKKFLFPCKNRHFNQFLSYNVVQSFSFLLTLQKLRISYILLYQKYLFSSFLNLNKERFRTHFDDSL